MGLVEINPNTKILLSPPYVETQYSNGAIAIAYRDPNEQNYAQAFEQGYKANDWGLYASLAEHEALHTVVANIVWKLPESPVLLQAAGMTLTVPYYQALYEEAMVIALQHYLNGKDTKHVLKGWKEQLYPAAIKVRRLLDLVQ